MSWLDWLSTSTTQRLALALVHFLWQGLVVASGTAALSSVLDLRRATVRYRVFLVGLILMAACPAITFVLLDEVAEPGAGSSSDFRGAETFGSPAPAADAALAAAPAAQPSVGVIESTREAFSLTSACPWIVLVWLAGACAFTTRLLAGLIGLRRLVRSTESIPGGLELRIDELCRRLRVRRLRGVFASARVSGAMAIGFLRPLVLIPAPWLSRFPPAVLEAVLAHELAHIRRGDLWVNLLQRIVEALLFYHPAVWWLSRRITAEREKCCDELAAHALREPAGYASALEAVARLTVLEEPAPLAAGIAGSRGSLLERVRYVLGLTPCRERLSWWLLPLLAVVMSLATVTVAIRPITADVDPERAAVLEGLDRIEEHLRDLRSSVRVLIESGTLRNVEPDFAGPSAHMHADNYFDLGRYRVAAKGYEASLAQNPGPRHRLELLQRAREAHRRSGNLDRAIAMQERVVAEEHVPDRYRALATLALLNKEAKRYSEAVRHGTRAVEAATHLEERLKGLNFRAWYIELARGAEAGLRAYEAAERLAASLGMSESNPTKRCRKKIERLERILASRAERGAAS